MLPFSRTFTFCSINNRLCKHHGTAPSLAKILSFKYFRESSLLKQVKRPLALALALALALSL